MTTHPFYRGVRLVSVAGLIILATTLLSFTPTAADRPCCTLAQQWESLVNVRSAPNHTMLTLLPLLVALSVVIPREHSDPDN